MHFVFYNVENLFDTENNPRTKDDDFTASGSLKWDEGRYYEKLDSIAEVAIAAAGGSPPAFLALCEVENYEVVKALAEHRDLSHIGYKIIHADSRDQRGIDNALIYNPNAFELEEYRWLNIDEHSDNQLHSRDILHAWGKVPSGQRCHIFVNHWPSRRKGKEETARKRAAAANTLKGALEKIDLRNDLLIACGDFNDTPSDDSLQILKTIDQAQELVNLAEWQEVNKHGSVFRDEQWWAFDQFIVNQLIVDRLEGKQMKIFDDELVLYKGRSGAQMPNRTYVGHRYIGGYSDHLAISLKLNL
jgi:hypothetical protein